MKGGGHQKTTWDYRSRGEVYGVQKSVTKFLNRSYGGWGVNIKAEKNNDFNFSALSPVSSHNAGLVPIMFIISGLVQHSIIVFPHN